MANTKLSTFTSSLFQYSNGSSPSTVRYFARVIVGHGHNVEDRAHARFKAAFAFLRTH